MNSQDRLKELHEQKGKIITDIEILQYQLKQTNAEIMKERGLYKDADKD